MTSNVAEGALGPAHDSLARTRDLNTGRFLRDGEEPAPKTAPRREAKKRLRTERDYLRRIVSVFGEDDVEAVVRAIRDDAVGKGETDVKVVNAAREWIGKYLLGNARVSLDDVQRQPAIVKRK